MQDSDRRKLERRATRLVKDERGEVTYGRETLIRLKIEDLVQDEHLSS